MTSSHASMVSEDKGSGKHITHNFFGGKDDSRKKIFFFLPTSPKNFSPGEEPSEVAFKHGTCCISHGDSAWVCIAHQLHSIIVQAYAHMQYRAESRRYQCMPEKRLWAPPSLLFQPGCPKVPNGHPIVLEIQ